MRRMGQTSRVMTGILMLTLVSFTFSACGVTGSDLAGGGTGGTGVSTGTITGFGSVVMNGVHYLTDENTSKMFNGMDNSSRMDRELFRVGMVVTIRHSPSDNNAQGIEYRDNLQGPVADKFPGADNTVTILGHTVVVDNAMLFRDLNPNDVLAVSGFVDSSGRIRAGYADMVPCSVMMMCPVTAFEVKGFVSDLSLSRSDFRLGPLPGGTGTAVTVSYAAAGIALDNGMYVQVVTADAQPVSGVIVATDIQQLSPRTVFPESAMADLEGLVTTPPSGTGNVLSFAVEGKPVRTDGNTQFVGGVAAGIGPDVRLQVQGTENGGVLSAGRIIFR